MPRINWLMVPVARYGEDGAARPAVAAAAAGHAILLCMASLAAKSGLAAGKLFDDPDVLPIKGQLTVLAPQPEVDYITIGPGDLYMMPRQDGIILGGTRRMGIIAPFSWRARIIGLLIVIIFAAQQLQEVHVGSPRRPASLLPPGARPHVQTSSAMAGLSFRFHGGAVSATAHLTVELSVLAEHSSSC